LKIFINYRTTDEPWGGVNSFIKSFQKYIIENRKDIEVVSKIDDDFDILLIAASYYAPSKEISLNDLKKILSSRNNIINKLLKKRQFKFVERLDGLRAIYNNEFIPNDKIQIELSQLADHIIFQSAFSLNNFQQFGYQKKNYSVICNGVDQNIFNLKNRSYYKKGKIKILSISWSTNLKKGFQTIADFSTHPEVESYFIGRWNDEINPKNVKIIPPKKHDILATYYKECDIFLHPAINDFCPNVVFEAMSCGLPIIYSNTGGTPEIASQYGISLPETMTADSIGEMVTVIKQQYQELTQRLVNDANNFSIQTVADKYICSFKKILKK
jgi:glycosyltransferase involved in cell wall biosynthesis